MSSEDLIEQIAKKSAECKRFWLKDGELTEEDIEEKRSGSFEAGDHRTRLAASLLVSGNMKTKLPTAC
jgi:hypothetical protein